MLLSSVFQTRIGSDQDPVSPIAGQQTIPTEWTNLISERDITSLRAFLTEYHLLSGDPDHLLTPDVGMVVFATTRAITSCNFSATACIQRTAQTHSIVSAAFRPTLLARQLKMMSSKLWESGWPGHGLLRVYHHLPLPTVHPVYFLPWTRNRPKATHD